MNIAERKRRVAAAIKAADAVLQSIDPTTDLYIGLTEKATVQWFAAFAAHGGVVLNDKRWRTDAGAVEVFNRYVSRALERGEGVDTVFADFCRDDGAAGVVQKGQEALEPFTCERDALLLDMLRELNRAHRETGRNSAVCVRLDVARYVKEHGY